MSVRRETTAAVQRYEFGRNWRHFLTTLNIKRITAAEQSLKRMLEVDDLVNTSFLDVGSGSGLFSLAARRLGARHVHSFDYDPDSVACTRELRRRYFPDDPDWTVEQGSVLDAAYLNSLGKFDVVYAWGVLHHTSAMWRALENVLIPLVEGGALFIAIYNDQGWISAYWRHIKRIYTAYPACRFLIASIHAPILICTRALPRLMNGRVTSDRGMALWYDLKDWLGGYPFEVASPASIIAFYQDRGYTLAKLRPSGDPSGNNEFVFRSARRMSPRLPGAGSYQAEHMEQIFDRYVAARFDSAANKAYYDFWCDRVLAQVRSETRPGVFLELMCGTGELLARFDAPPGVRKLGIDLTHRMLAYGAARHGAVGQFVCGDARRLPLADASVQTIVIQGGLHHVARDLQTVTAEIGRVLIPGGVLACTEPSDDNWAVRWIRRIVYQLFKIFDAESERGLRRSELRACFEAAGLTLEEFQPFGYAGYALIANTDVLGLCRNLRWPPAVRLLIWLDALLQKIPLLSSLGWMCILRARKLNTIASPG